MAAGTWTQECADLPVAAPTALYSRMSLRAGISAAGTTLWRTKPRPDGTEERTHSPA